MIDTVRFSVECDTSLIKKIKQFSQEVKKHDHSLGEDGYNYFTCPVFLPSYFRGVNIFHDFHKESKIFFELSLPKFVYGHNIFLLSISEAKEAIGELRKIFVDKFGTFPEVETWLINRIDLCYAWDCETPENALSLLDFARSRGYPRKKRADYQTSIYASSQLSTVKFYIKGAEFKKHDYGYLKKSDLSRAKQLLSLSNNIFRFEVELRKKGLDSEFGKGSHTVDSLIKDDIIQGLLTKYFTKSMSNLPTTFEQNQSVYKKLLHFTGSPRKAIKLFEFYKMLNSPLSEERNFLKMSYGESTIYRKKAQLREAMIGFVPESDYFHNFQFEIPSKNQIKNYLVAVDGVSRLPLTY